MKLKRTCHSFDKVKLFKKLGYKITALGYSNSRVSMSYFLEKDL